MCAVEMNLTWKLTGTERLTLYYDSVEELGQLACFKCLFLLRAGVTSESSMYSRTSLIRTPKGQSKVSVLERCPY